MITLKEARADYYFFSGKLSDVVRQLSLAGIGIVWILRVGRDTNGVFKFEAPMANALSAFCLALLLDLLQYASAAAIWGFYCRYKEKRGGAQDGQLFPSPKMNWPALGCFWGKAFFCVIGLWTLLHYLGKQF